MRFSKMISATLAVLFIVFSSCTKTDNDSNIPAAGLMAFNLATDQPATNITLSGNILPGSPMDYLSYTGGYLRIFPGSRTVAAFDYFTGSMLTNSSYNFEPNKYYTLFVIGNLKNYSNVIVKDNLDSLDAAKGGAFIRYINAIPDSGKPVVSVTAEKSVIDENAPFGKVSDFTQVTAGQVTVSVKNDNTINATRTIKLDELKAYTILLTGDPKATDSTKKIQIRYIENGTVTDVADQRTITSANSRSSN
ncbi:DUF4397 domain-containing protein [Danxiaibacter flavus]|uniref:DUF4397 domain-containing protein n=1 Tax=Danxiaibacter flavus TaxID=3049108 RepID=A0ABV3ZIU0_9BACT|nr:DUF4397 domain-containing protein [Chitinophagaceae bacterium DXS]